MRRVFADAFFYIAVLNRKDAAHHRAIEFIAVETVEVVTTTAVLLEVGDAMSAPAHRIACGEFLADLAGQPQTTLRQINDDRFVRGLALYGRRLDKAWSLTDCLSFIVMADEERMEALTGGRHFEQAGFRALLAG